MTITVLVVDDEALLRSTICGFVDVTEGLAAVGSAGNGIEAVELARSEQPDVVLMDLSMPGMDGIEATRRITSDPQTAGVKVLALTTFSADEYVYDVLRAGASGFLLKDIEAGELVRAIRVVAEGEALISPAITRRLISEFARRPEPTMVPRLELSSVTHRETEVLLLVARGMSNAEVAKHLNLSAATVRTHVSHLLSKLHARDRAQLVMVAYESGLIRVGGG